MSGAFDYPYTHNAIRSRRWNGGVVARASSLWDADRVQFDGAARRLRKRRV